MGIEMRSRVKVAMILPDDRDIHKRPELPQPWFGPAPRTLLEGFRGIPEEVEVHVVSCERTPVPPTPQLAPNIFFHPIRVPRLAYMRTLYIGSVLAIRRALKRIQPELVHGQGTECYAGLAAAYSGRPNVLTIHGNMRAVARAMGAGRFSFHGVLAMLEGRTIRRSDGVLCLSSYTERQVSGLARRTWRVPNAVASECFSVSVRPQLPARLLCVGTICSYKNQNALIHALEPLAAAGGIRLIFAGGVDGEAYGGEFKRLVSERPWCEYLGRLSPEEIREQLGRATLLVHPSLEDNCPMVILEAMAAGLPVIASTCGGIPDLVEPGRTGLLCAPENMGRFAEAIQHLLSHPEIAQSFGEEARRRALQQFEPVAVARKHVEIYREMIASSRRVSRGPDTL